ncbi:MAG: response regulator transcription factor [Anaeromicrobium sp.]|jgi:two-component system alkaline phosphatase synthesis response regulator PhoP|uniref:response regulator n=1 Tax=Anaeromicrobium sp. TaxID=1929132 RepID=UPI0025CF334B|nr:response regulator transcription factor [Anaeromicrobium sp.]MCT4593369.1 response regulator transcription factor [Anaeromicrobium sp.]
MKEKNILVVDDEIHILELLKYNLESNGFSVVTAEDGQEAIEKLEENIDLVLLDVMLPILDGIETLKIIKEKKKNLPVIMVTAKGEEIDTVIGLEVGADDYITKPFRIRELIARIKAVLRRSESQGEKKEETVEITIEDIKINEESREVSIKDEKIDLPKKEFELLLLLVKNKEKVFTRESLLEKIWGYDYYGETRTVDVHIRNLRKKLEGSKVSSYIKTLRGVGYKLSVK